VFRNPRDTFIEPVTRQSIRRADVPWAILDTVEVQKLPEECARGFQWSSGAGKAGHLLATSLLPRAVHARRHWQRGVSRAHLHALDGREVVRHVDLVRKEKLRTEPRSQDRVQPAWVSEWVSRQAAAQPA